MAVQVAHQVCAGWSALGREVVGLLAGRPGRAGKIQNASLAPQVNAHLNSEVERLTLAKDTLEQEKGAYQRHIKDLARKLAEARAQLPEAQAAAAEAAAAEAAALAEEEAALGGELLQSDAFAAANRAGADGGSSGGGEGGEQPWLSEAAWQQLQQAGRRAGWLADPSEVVLGEVIGKGTFGEQKAGGGSWELPSAEAACRT